MLRLAKRGSGGHMGFCRVILGCNKENYPNNEKE